MAGARAAGAFSLITSGVGSAEGAACTWASGSLGLIVVLSAAAAGSAATIAAAAAVVVTVLIGQRMRVTQG